MKSLLPYAGTIGGSFRKDFPSWFIAAGALAFLMAATPCVWARMRVCPRPSQTVAAPGEKAGEQFLLQSVAFQPGGNIPRKFTCDGPDLSPALNWTAPPSGTQSFALIMDDPDAPGGTWVHWVLYDLPGSLRQLVEGIPKSEELRGGGRQGVNDFPEVGYDGPCPPPGKPHRYFFKLYALATKLNLPPKASKMDVERAMKGYILGQAQLIGRYGR